MGKSIKKFQEQKEKKEQEYIDTFNKSKYISNRSSKPNKKISYESFVDNFLYGTRSYNLIRNYRTKFIRSPKDWKPSKKSVNSLIIDLIQHLFVKYSYPSFFNYLFSTTNRGRQPELNYEQNFYFDWFLTIAQGQSIYKEIFQYYGLTKRESHYFLKAPGFIKSPQDSLLFSIIRAEVKDNKTKEYFDLFKSAYIPRNYIEHKDFFYLKAFKFFCRQDIGDLKTCYTEIVDYLFRSNINRSEFSFKNRTLNSIKQLSNTWHIQQMLVKHAGKFEWESFREETTWNSDEYKLEYRGWRCVELTTSDDLIKEGRQMHHCVASYARSCFQGYSHIYSFYNPYISERYTIEVGQFGSIVQIRAAYNQPPSKLATKVIRLWARDFNIKYFG